MQVLRNVRFNFVGSAFIALSLVISIPFYIRFLGSEAFGLLGVLYTLTALTASIDFGLSSTLTRELARYSECAHSRSTWALTLRSLEWLIWLIALCGLLFSLFYLPKVSNQWLRNSHLSADIVSQCMMWIGACASLQIVINFYGAGLIGLQRLGTYNILFASIAVLKAMISILGLSSGWLDVVDFFILHFAFSVMHACIAMTTLWWGQAFTSTLPSWRVVTEIKAFSLSVWGAIALGILLTQIDKFILSFSLDLKKFGYYVMAWNIAVIVIRPALPIYYAYLPQFSQLASDPKNNTQLARIYHQACRQVALFVWPLSITLALCSYPLLNFYTGSEEIAGETYIALSFLVFGSALNAVMQIPFALLQASGNVSLAVRQNLIACLVMLPLYILVAREGSIVIAAMAWFALNLGYVSLSIYFMHKIILPGHAKQWYLKDNFLGFFLPSTK